MRLDYNRPRTLQERLPKIYWYNKENELLVYIPIFTIYEILYRNV